jgi:GSH-dependent disulfide-bond oxidoreductase
MIDFYAMGSPNVVKVYIALEELGLAYKVHPVDVWKGDQFMAEFAKLNPNAKVPIIVDAQGPGGKPITVFESGAILLYLSEKTGKLLPKKGAARYDALQWMMVQMTSVGPMSGQLVHFVRFAPKGNDYALSRYKTQVATIYKVLDDRLGAAKFLGGAEYGVADIATFPWARLMETFFPDFKTQHAHVARWLGEINARPAVVKALAAADDVRTKISTFDKVAADNLDRMFGRGRYAVS